MFCLAACTRTGSSVLCLLSVIYLWTHLHQSAREISEVLPAIEGKLAICLWAKFLIFDDGVIMLPAPKTVRHVIECNKILVCVWMGSILACINSISKLQTDLDLSIPSSSCHKQNTRILLDKQKSTDQQTKIHRPYKTNQKQQSYKTNKIASIL